MNFLSQQKYTLSTLSPIHIGCGEDYEPGNYIIDNGFLFTFDATRLFARLNIDQIKRFESIVDNIDQDQKDALKKLQSFFYDMSDNIQTISDYQFAVPAQLENFYKERIGKAVQIEKTHDEGEKKVINKLEIERTVHNPQNHQYYIPGSSIKGALRSAILDALKQITRLRPEEKKDKNLSQKLQQTVFEYNKVWDDPFKHLKVSDAHWQSHTPVTPATIYFAINKKRKLSDQITQAEEKGLYQILECVLENLYQSFHLDIRITNQFICSSFEKIAEYANRFYLPMLEAELSRLQQHHFLSHQWQQRIQTVLDGEIRKQLEQGRAILLKLGKHGGADTKTVNDLRSIHIPQNKSQPYQKTPTTDWLAATSHKSNKNLQPFGWVLLQQQGLQDVNLETLMGKQNQIIRKRQIQLQQQLLDKKQKIAQQLAQYQAQQQKEAAAWQAKREKREKQLEQQKLQRKEQLKQQTAGKSELAQEIIRQKIEKNWFDDKTAFMQDGLIEQWLEKIGQDPQADALDEIIHLLDKHVAGLLKDPDAVKGKKKKPKYSSRQRKIAHQIHKLKQKIQ